MNIYFFFIMLSFFGKSININKNFSKWNYLSHRLRNTSMRFIVFNNFCKRFREETIKLIRLKENTLTGEYDLLVSNYYDLIYRYYSMEEEDRNNLELLFSLVC